MRLLLNHGLRPGELYKNTPKTITDKKTLWFRNNFGWSKTLEDSLSGPFQYCFSLILNRVIDDKVRFKLPVKTEAYIDFEIVSGEDFVKQKQNGRFPEIDFIESDFTGYFLNYVYRAKAYNKIRHIYIGGDLKQKFLNGINSGIKYYTIKDITIDDFIDEVHQKFSALNKNEVKKLLLLGFRRMHSAIKYGCYLTISSERFNCFAFIGSITLIPDKQIKEYSMRRDRKLRKIDGWAKTPFDGYYYIGLNHTGFERWLEDNKKTRTVVKFRNVIPRKLKEELYYKDKQLHIFRFKRDTFKGYAYWADELNIRKLEYLGEVYDRKFIPSNKTWQELKKEYEKRDNIDILGRS